MLRYLALGLFVALSSVACSSSRAPSPFVDDDAGVPESGTEGGPDAAGDGPLLGQPCVDDSQCNDRVDCTQDSCNHNLGRCQFVVDDTRCQDGLFCNGVERCDPLLGCRAGGIVACNDDQTCTIDSCVESTRTCKHELRDADGDGVPDGHCQTGADCNDDDPTVYPGHPEICDNRKDDNCDGRIDETPCQKPVHDTCADPLVITASGIYSIDTTAAAFDYPGSCAPMNPSTRKDVVAAIVLNGDPQDVDVVAEAPSGAVSVGIARDCGILASELACDTGVMGATLNEIARFRAHALPAGNYPLYVWTDRDEAVLLHVTLRPPTTPPTNETCATAKPVTLGSPITLSLVDTRKDLASRCGFESGDLVYRFDLSTPADVTAFAASIDGYGTPVVSIRKAACAMPNDEIACGYGSPARAFVRALAAGTYYVAVSASVATDVKLEVDAASPTQPPADETCNGAPMLAPNRTIDVPLANHTDDIDLGCALIASVDAAYDLELATTSDVLLVERISDGDTGAVSLSAPACAGAASELVCGKDGSSPVRASLRSVAPGSYRAVVESAIGAPVQLTAFVRPAVPPSLVPFADTCASATTIAETGGFYEGNTANASADYSAGCDQVGVAPGGAPDQMLKFVLSTKKRVVFDMQGSSYWTLLDVRRGATCPGLEMPNACSAGYLPLRSYLDLTLDPGTYWIQVDGYYGDSGTWFLDVRVTDP